MVKKFKEKPWFERALIIVGAYVLVALVLVGVMKLLPGAERACGQAVAQRPL